MAMLVDKLDEMRTQLSPLELENYKLLLGIAAGGLAPHGDTPIGGARAEAFRTVLRSLARVQPTGLAWRGRPSLITDQLLSDLQNEASDVRASAKPTDRYLLGCGGPVADRFAASQELNHFVAKIVGDVASTGVASYVLYDREGAGLDPHIDTEIFSINFLLMLRHEYVAEPSHLVLYPVDEEPLRLLLTPGECVLFHAGATVHGREDLKRDEVVTLLTIGFQSVGR